MRTLIFIDDERDFKDVTWINYPQYEEIVTFRTHEEFTNFCDNVFGGNISKLSFNNLDFSFDHDLQSFDKYGKEWTGYDCIKYLLDTTYLTELESGIYSKDSNDISESDFYFHTKNPIGLDNMRSYYLNFLNFIER